MSLTAKYGMPVLLFCLVYNSFTWFLSQITPYKDYRVTRYHPPQYSRLSAKISRQWKTSSSAMAERPRDASRMSWGLRGNARTPSIARWKARGRLPIRHNWTFFRYLLRLRRYKRKSVEVAVFRRGWVTLSANFRRTWRRPPTTVGVRKLEWFIFVRYQNIRSALFVYVTKHALWQTDRRTDGQNYDSQDRASIAASRGKHIGDIQHKLLGSIAIIVEKKKTNWAIIYLLLPVSSEQPKFVRLSSLCIAPSRLHKQHRVTM